MQVNLSSPSTFEKDQNHLNVERWEIGSGLWHRHALLKSFSELWQLVHGYLSSIEGTHTYIQSVSPSTRSGWPPKANHFGIGRRFQLREIRGVTRVSIGRQHRSIFRNGSWRQTLPCSSCWITNRPGTTLRFGLPFPLSPYPSFPIADAIWWPAISFLSFAISVVVI